MKMKFCYRMAFIAKCVLTLASLDLWGDVEQAHSYSGNLNRETPRSGLMLDSGPFESIQSRGPIKAVDVNQGAIVLNQPGMVSVVIETGPDSWRGAKVVYTAVYPFQGKNNFRFIPVVDLHKSLAAWFPSIAVGQMQKNLDMEASDLKPYFLKNGNHGDPRAGCHLVPDFKGSLISQLNWNGPSNQVHVIVYGADAREVQRWEKISDPEQLQAVVRSALRGAESGRTRTEVAEISTGSK